MKTSTSEMATPKNNNPQQNHKPTGKRIKTQTHGNKKDININTPQKSQENPILKNSKQETPDAQKPTKTKTKIPPNNLKTKTWKRWHRRLEFQKNIQRKEVLNTNQGNCTLNIVSINPDALTTQESRQRLTEELLRNKIHLAAIQETHIAHGQNYLHNGYRIITSAAIKNTSENKPGMSEGGVAILIHENIAPHITHIHRISRRTVKITLQSKNSHTPVTIINTYAPHQGKTNSNKKNTGKKHKKQYKKHPLNI